MRLLKEYNLEILTVLMVLMVTLIAAVAPEVSLAQRMLVVYMFLYTLHEWEENRYPGGFSDLMEGMLGKTFAEDAKKMSHIPVAILLLAIHIIPFVLDTVMPLVLIPVFLGLFEGFVHTMGVKLSGAERFYTPGMVTAYCLAAFSVFCIVCFGVQDMAGPKDYLLGFVCMFASFALMQNRVLAINGVKYTDMMAMMRRKLAGK